MKKELTLIEIADDQPMRQWAKDIMGKRNAEAVESLKREKVIQETVFILELNNKKYLAFYMEGEMLHGDPDLPINQEHRRILRSVRESFVDAELLYNLQL